MPAPVEQSPSVRVEGRQSCLSANDTRDKQDCLSSTYPNLSAAVLNATSECVWLFDETGRTLWANERLAALLGEPLEQLQEENFLDFATAGVAAERFRACSSNRSEQRCEMSFVRGGKTACVDVRLLPFGGNDGSSHAVLAMITDVTSVRESEEAILRAAEELERRLHGDEAAAAATERKPEPQGYRERLLALTAQIVAANRELEAFSYSVAHDLREPLRSVDGFSRILLERYGAQLDERGRDYLGRVRAAAQRMGHLIADMLTLARIARAEMSSGPVDLTAIARSITSGLADADPGRDVTVTVSDDLTAVGDTRLLRVVLTNLLSNAWKFTSKSANARIDVTRAQSATDDVFLVSDNGAGFEMKYVEKLFRPFQRLHSHEDFAGTGVGLATVQRIVTRHGGKVWAEAVVGNGARVCFSIPRARAEEKSAA